MNLDDRIRDGLSRALDAASLPEGDAALAMERGVALRKRKNRRSVALVAASVVLILGAGVGLQQVAAGDGDDRREPTPTDQVPVAPDGMRLVGMGRVVVAVPEEWHANPNYSCAPDKADEDTATLRIQRDKPQGRPLFCLTLGVSFFALDSPKGQAVPVSKMVPDVINGLDVIRSPDRPCHLNVTRHCPETVVVPSENVIVEFTTVDAAGFDHIIDTLRLLPAGFTTVPLIARRTPLSEATAVIKGAGLRVDAGSAPEFAPVLATEPAAGSVMPEGGVVGLSAEAATCGTGPQASPPPCEPEDPGTTCPSGASAGDPEEPDEPVSAGPNYPVNESGMTYGGAPDGDYPEPDLIAVSGNCGRFGYALRIDLQDPEPWSPEAGSEAGAPRTIPVYAVDGTTQIDTFTIGDAEGSSSDGDTTSPQGPDAADVQGEWSVTIAGVQSPDGKPQYDTYRDLDLTATVSANSIRVHDGCQSSAAEFTLISGEFTVTENFETVSLNQEVQCNRQAPLVDILNNVRHVTKYGGGLYMHLDNFQIVLSLRPQGR